MQSQNPALSGKVLLLLAFCIESALICGINPSCIHVEIDRVHFVLVDLAAEVLKHT